MQVTDGVWTFSKEFTRFGFIPFGGRSTAVRLSSGGVWVLASTPLTAETKSAIDALGPVHFVVSPDSFHHLFLGRRLLQTRLWVLNECRRVQESIPGGEAHRTS